MTSPWTADVLVVGGGIVGTATAYYLARLHGLRVVLLERRFLASGSTGRCICGIRQQFSHADTIRMAVASVRMYETMEEELGRSVEFYQGGYLFLAHDEEQLSRYRSILPLQRSLGVPVSLLDPAETAALVPGMNPEGLLGAAYCPTDGQANPFLVVQGYAEGLRRLGGQVVTGAEVVHIEVGKGGRVGGVRTLDGRVFSAPAVVLAVGPFLRDVAALAGVEVPVSPERHEALITEPTTPGLVAPMLVDYRNGGCYFTQLHRTGQIIACITPVPSVPGLRLDSSLAFLGQAASRIVRLVPALGRVKVLRSWAGSYEVTPDGNPVLGVTPVGGLYVAGGFCGHGFMLGPMAGKLMADLVATGRNSPLIDAFALDRDFGQTEAMR